MYKQIISIDPGGSSGIAVRLRDGQLITCIANNICINDDCTAIETDIDRMTYKCKLCNQKSKPTVLYEMLTQPGIEHVVFETFQAQTISKYGLHTVRLVGAIEALCWKLNIPYTEHMPMHRKPFMADAEQELQRIGLRYVVHEKDALAHLLRWEHDNNNG